MQSSGSNRLTVRQGPVPGKIFELAKDMMTIGRDVNNDLVINDSEISRNHSRLTAQSGGYLIEDLASTNGTFVNGQRLIGPKLLNAGDVVGLGETIVLEYGYVADSGATVIASMPMPMAPRVPADPPTAPPVMPMPEPMAPEPMMAEAPMMAAPMMSSTPPMMGGVSTSSMATPPMAPPPPAMAPKKNNRNMYIGIGCGCLSLCGCAVLLYGVVTYLPVIRSTFGF